MNPSLSEKQEAEGPLSEDSGSGGRGGGGGGVWESPQWVENCGSENKFLKPSWPGASANSPSQQV